MDQLLHGIIGIFKTGTDFDAQTLFPNIRVQGVWIRKILGDLKESIYPPDEEQARTSAKALESVVSALSDLLGSVEPYTQLH
jgi:hypothetical protein